MNIDRTLRAIILDYVDEPSKLDTSSAIETAINGYLSSWQELGRVQSYSVDFECDEFDGEPYMSKFGLEIPNGIRIDVSVKNADNTTFSKTYFLRTNHVRDYEEITNETILIRHPNGASLEIKA